MQKFSSWRSNLVALQAHTFDLLHVAIYHSEMNNEDVTRFRSGMKLLQRRMRREVLPVAGASRTALQVLGAAGRLGQGTQPRQIADELQMTSSNVAASLRELETADLIRREADPADGRRVLIFVTELGTSLVGDLRNEKDTWLGRAIEASLDEAEQALLSAAGRLMERLADYEEALAPRVPGNRSIRESSERAS
jgi:DNA-binding MarR family transcriptional regulator